MKVVFLSNFFNHHQKPFSDEMFSLLGNNYVFISTDEIPEERKKLGYREITAEYAISIKHNKEQCERIIKDADIVILGSAPYDLIKERIKEGKIVFKYSERPFKKGIEPLKYLPRLFKWRKEYPQNKKVYLLCASAYTSSDYSKLGLFKNRALKWGYFPQTIKYDNLNEIIKTKKKNSILWCGRLIDWKHPESCIFVAKKLLEDGYDFQLNIIGMGDLKEEIKQRILENGLEKHVKFLGPMSPEQVREQMEKSEIYLFTSNRQEGWGAVLNEAMNSACAVVSSHAIGSVPFLVQDGKNGLIFKSEDFDDLYKKVKYLLDNEEKKELISRSAYDTIINEWTSKVAAQRLLRVAENLLNGKCAFEFNSGPCSKAEKIKDNWFII